ncbi:MAG: exodeoxyribonuclease VII large subunit [Candidatus Kapabacteria bacterium]|nr:exodeoxyribonuclease VII large subunit [Candidatus Kapabacteria bacterium]
MIRLQREEDKITLSVSELTEKISRVLEREIGIVSVSGEISNYKLHSSGHRYFTLKDGGASISCVLWRGRQLKFNPSDGMKVVVRGSISVFPPRGQYQLDCDTIEPAGMGDLFVAFEALKAKLEAAGYFDSNRKRKIPQIVTKIGVATSPTGAVIRDITTTLERRFPAIQIYFRPTLVQGEGSSDDIVKAIRELNATDAQVIILARGGGSLEDLWSFNEEKTADAIFNSKKPLISAVGHETDFTISDFVADLRAATPTAAAELVSRITQSDFLDNLSDTSSNITKMLMRKINEKKQYLDYMTGTAAFGKLEHHIKTSSLKIDEIQRRIESNLSNKMNELNTSIESKSVLINSLYPLAPLGKGFAIIKRNGKIINKDQSLYDFQKIEIEREKETVFARIEKQLQDELF